MVLAKSLMYVAPCIYQNTSQNKSIFFFQFLWGQGKRAKVKREVMINSKTLGGAKMIDFKNIIFSMKALWIKRF